jgi:hypothetical protein
MVEGDPKGTVYQFKIPSKSLFGKGVGNTHPFESYTKFLAGNGESPDTVVTQIAHDPNNQSQTYVLNFKPIRQVSDDEYELVLAAQKNPDTDMYTKITTAQTDQVTALPPSAQIEYSDEPMRKKILRSWKKRSQLSVKLRRLNQSLKPTVSLM